MRMILYYSLIVESTIEFIRYSRELIAGIKSQDYVENEEACTTVLADGYRLEYLAMHDKYYCLKGSQDL